MKANELRIGNWVYAQSNKLITMVPLRNNDDGTKFFQIRVVTTQESHKWHPIPLSPEILKAAGFVKDGFGAYNISLPQNFQTSVTELSFSSDYLYLRQQNNEKRHEDSIIVLWNKDLMKTFYLHQLQNLFHSLTGEELQITL